MKDLSEAIIRLMRGESLDDTIFWLLEAVTNLHIILGKLKKQLRELKELSSKGGFRSTLATSKPTVTNTNAANHADTTLKLLLDYWLSKRVQHLQASEYQPDYTPDLKDKLEEVSLLATHLSEANVNDDVLMAAIRASEAAKKIKEYLD